jgi:Na+-translocating ferredoxin:NAD+ oxidoreductase RnfC subunit
MKNDWIQQVQDAGIVGAGGAGFPTHVKLNAEAETLVVNGAECEPLLRVDQQLMERDAIVLVKTLDQWVEAIGAKQGIFGLKEKYHGAIDALNAAVQAFPRISVYAMPNVYPAGDEQFLVYETVGKVVPEGGIPLQVGVIVVNVETLLNLSKAFEGEPVTETYVTITGEVKNPGTYAVPVGTALPTLIKWAGGVTVEPYAVIDGGPMMGKLIEDPQQVMVKKASKGYIVLPVEHMRIQAKKKKISQMLKEAKTACCHCNLCTDICPRYQLGHDLHPAKLMRMASYQSLGDASASLDEAYLCCECGLCEIACIMNLQPWKLNISLKDQLREMGIKNSHHKAPEEARAFREYRNYPTHRLIANLGLRIYDVPAPIRENPEAVEEVRISLSQGIGAPSLPVIAAGDQVKKGDLIAKIPEGKLGSNVHASISGKVIALGEDSVLIRNERQGGMDQ